MAETSEPLAECQNCGKRWPLSALRPVRDILRRVSSGEPMPAGECPDCGAVAHETAERPAPEMNEEHRKAWRRERLDELLAAEDLDRDEIREAMEEAGDNVQDLDEPERFLVLTQNTLPDVSAWRSLATFPELHGAAEYIRGLIDGDENGATDWQPRLVVDLDTGTEYSWTVQVVLDVAKRPAQVGEGEPAYGLGDGGAGRVRGVHWTDKRRAEALLGGALRDLGWKLYGWTADQSDMMTDYYSPEHWDGVATLAGAVAVVGMGRFKGCAERPKDSGHTEERYQFVPAESCATCGGSGDDPSGWTLEAARADPRRFHRETNAPGTLSLLADVVSPVPFKDGGKLKCSKCCGRGHLLRHEMQKGETWPVFEFNPGRANWHVERGGRILASGTGVYSALHDKEQWTTNREQDERRAARFLAIAQKMTDAARGDERPAPLPGRQVEGVALSEVDGAGVGATVRPSSMRDGYVEVVFAAKPPDVVREELKAARFRWSGRSGCWYGPTERLPVRYAAPAVSQ